MVEYDKCKFSSASESYEINMAVVGDIRIEIFLYLLGETRVCLVGVLWTRSHRNTLKWENGYQWRSWPDPKGGHVDQLAKVVHSIKHNPDSRRHMVTAWNPADVDSMALPPCHALFQFYVAQGRLSCQLYQRSADIFLGVPFNIASYALLTQMVAQVCDLQPGDFVHTLGDAHLYSNHLEQADQQLARQPLVLPTLELNPQVKDLFAFTFDDIHIKNYQYHPHIKAPVAV